jgi:hypothetical protein
MCFIYIYIYSDLEAQLDGNILYEPNIEEVIGDAALMFDEG